MILMLATAILVAATATAADEMKKLDFMTGEWKGEAWIRMGPGEPQYVLQTERVQPKAGGRVLMIEGLGKRKLENGEAGDVVHEAFAVIVWDEEKKAYRFDAYTARDGHVPATLELTGENKGTWGFTTPQGGKVRYTINLTEKGEWHEVGEFSRDGNQWMKFMEMTLTKQ
jgi:hypothetical protein